ncbi:MAG TPA: hypothetical protein VF771_14460 [Longimicrobiaceae bacterium]
MRFRLLLPLLPLLAAACSGGPTTAAGSCTYAARVNDTDYGWYRQASADNVGPEFTRTLRHRECDDVIEFGTAHEPWRNGDSSFAANTPLYAALDEPPSEVLLVRWYDGTWMELRKLPHPGSPAAGG